MKRLTACVILVALISTPAFARHYHGHHHRHVARTVDRQVQASIVPADDRYPNLVTFVASVPHARGFRGRGRGRMEYRGAYYAMVTAAAHEAGVPTHIAHAVIRMESGYNPRARNRSGAMGISQIKCATARGIGFRGSCAALLEAKTNLRYGMTYLKLAMNAGGPCHGLSRYEAGIGSRSRCSSYARKVMRMAGR